MDWFLIYHIMDYVDDLKFLYNITSERVIDQAYLVNIRNVSLFEIIENGMDLCLFKLQYTKTTWSNIETLLNLLELCRDYGRSDVINYVCGYIENPGWLCQLYNNQYIKEDIFISKVTLTDIIKHDVHLTRGENYYKMYLSQPFSEYSDPDLIVDTYNMASDWLTLLGCYRRVDVIEQITLFAHYEDIKVYLEFIPIILPKENIEYFLERILRHDSKDVWDHLYERQYEDLMEVYYKKFLV
jgi:hypothetical protein